MSYIEPCCCDRQMPALVKSHKTAFFQTAGDVTVQKMMKAVSHMAGSQMEMILVAQAVDIKLLRYVKTYFSRGWFTHLLLLTREEQADLVSKELKGQNVTYAHDPSITDDLLAFVPVSDASASGDKTVIILGAMLLKVEPAMRQYVIYAGQNEELIDGALAAVRSKAHLAQKPTTDSTNDTNTTTDDTDSTD